MRIILEPTTRDPQRSPDTTQHRVTIEHPDDDLTIDHVMELVQDALTAYGYTVDTVADYWADQAIEHSRGDPAADTEEETGH